MRKISKKERTLELLLAFIAAAVFVELFSYCSSLLYPWFFGRDSAQFLTIGHEWYLGNIPYAGEFDHKGPLIFFVNLLGYALGGGNKAGLALLQIPALTAGILGAARLARLRKDNLLQGVLGAGVFLLAVKVDYEQGNTVEEYCLPFIVWSVYFLFRYFAERREKGPRDHEPKLAFFYGITASVCLLTRLTNFMAVGPLVLAVCLLLLKEKRFGNLGKNALAAFIGLVLPLIPFSLYFAVKGCFYDYLNGMLLFNLKYMGGKTSWLFSADLAEFRWFALAYFSFYAVFPVGILRLLRKEWAEGLALLFLGLCEAALFLAGDDYGKYCMICAPQLVLLLMEAEHYLGEVAAERRLLGVAAAVLLCLYGVKGLDTYALPCWDYRHQYSTHEVREWESLTDRVPQEDSFLVYGYSELQEVYLISGLRPASRYAILQEWQGSFSEPHRENIVRELTEAGIQWILTDGHTRDIDAMLAEKYRVAAQTEQYILYTLR